MKNAWTKIVDFVFPKLSDCIICNKVGARDTGFLCDRCFSKLVPVYESPNPLCPKCFTPINGSTCHICGEWENERLNCLFLYPYEHPIDDIIKFGKYKGNKQILLWCGDELTKGLSLKEKPCPNYVMSAPELKKEQLKKGYDHARIIAERIAKNVNSSYSPALIKIRRTGKQARLSGEMRRKNLKNAFGCSINVTGLDIWLIDDVRTTGTTGRECAKVLFDKGAKSVTLITVAGTI